MLRRKSEKLVKGLRKNYRELKDLKYNPRFAKFCICAATAVFGVVIMSQPAYAAADKVDELTRTIAGYVEKFGGIVTFFGAAQAGYGLKSDDPEAKSKGVKTAVSGAAVLAIAKGYSTWIA